MVTDDLPERARIILQFLQNYIPEHGYAPTQRQIATACGIASIGSVNYWLKRLADLGWIRFEPGISRTIVLLDKVTG